MLSPIECSHDIPDQLCLPLYQNFNRKLPSWTIPEFLTHKIVSRYNGVLVITLGESLLQWNRILRAEVELMYVCTSECLPQFELKFCLSKLSKLVNTCKYHFTHFEIGIISGLIELCKN